MGVLEIVLLLAGVILAVLSFVLPAAKEEVPQETKKLAKEEIKTLVSQEMDGIRKHVDDVVDEAVGYAVEKTERSLERLTNEKIMAVNEYSDTVLQEIHKNHEEAMFLYDMLNDKHTSLKNTVSEAGRIMQEVEETRREAEAVVNSLRQLKQEADEAVPEDRTERDSFEELRENIPKPQSGIVPEEKTPKKSEAPKKNIRNMADETAEDKASPVMDLNFMTEGQDAGVNNKEQILQLYKQGKSTVAIAKELGLGVGEVKLVIDLYKNL